MIYRKTGSNYTIRIDRGEEILSSLSEICKKEGITSASVTAIGACDKVTVGVYDVENKVYHKKQFEGAFEIVNLTGNVSEKDGEVYLHFHISLADESFNVFGGHLNEARISATCEMFLFPIEETIDRFCDNETGLNLMKF